MSILSASGVRIEDISDLMGHSGTTVTESVYRHEIRPALTTGATAMNKILSKKRPDPPSPLLSDTKKYQPGWLPSGFRRSKRGPGPRSETPSDLLSNGRDGQI